MSYFIDENNELKDKNVAKVVIVGILFLVIGVSILFGTWGTVGAGERGVLLRFSAVAGVKEEGFYFKAPWIESVKIMDVKIQKEQVDASAASKDLQTVNSVVAVNFHLSPDKVVDIYKGVGLDYKSRIIHPAIQEAVKASTAKFTAEELITKRELVRGEIKQYLADKLLSHGLIVDELNIVNFDFSSSFNAAIEAKVTAEQDALAAKNKLEQSKYEAEQRIAQAKGEAEAIRIQAQAITQQGGADYVKLKAIEKWSGAVPNYVGTGSAIPFLQIP